VFISSAIAAHTDPTCRVAPVNYGKRQLKNDSKVERLRTLFLSCSNAIGGRDALIEKFSSLFDDSPTSETQESRHTDSQPQWDVCSSQPSDRPDVRAPSAEPACSLPTGSLLDENTIPVGDNLDFPLPKSRFPVLGTPEDDTRASEQFPGPEHVFYTAHIQELQPHEDWIHGPSRALGFLYSNFNGISYQDVLHSPVSEHLHGLYGQLEPQTPIRPQGTRTETTQDATSHQRQDTVPRSESHTNAYSPLASIPDGSVPLSNISFEHQDFFPTSDQSSAWSAMPPT
jgi:hypothetical protein